MYAFAIVWLLSTGQFVSEPWRDYPSIEKCEDARNAITNEGKDDRLILFSACLSKKALRRTDGSMSAIYFQLIPGENLK